MNHPRTTLLFIIACGTAFAAEGWTDLFNGRNLDGWVQHGGKAKYTVADGCIVGTSTLDTPTSYLCTEKTFGDFNLEFKASPKLNSGVQFRSECFDEKRQIDVAGKAKMMSAGMVFGYQLEIDADPAKEGLQVCWRHLRIQKISPSAPK